jgi:anti-sigma regulatory factor (Ser/Thr protein kinase)
MGALGETWSETVRLPADASAPALARETLDGWLSDVDADVRRDVRSVISELVAHAVREGASPIELSVQARAGRARVEVSDPGVGAGAPSPGYWSQRIISGLAATWDVRGDDAHVWFDLPLRARGGGQT